MQLRGEIELKKTEHSDALEFTVSREESILESVVFPVFALAVLWWFWRIGGLWPRILAGFAAISSAAAYIANRVQGGETRLRVTSDGVRFLGPAFQPNAATSEDPAADGCRPHSSPQAASLSQRVWREQSACPDKRSSLL